MEIPCQKCNPINICELDYESKIIRLPAREKDGDTLTLRVRFAEYVCLNCEFVEKHIMRDSLKLLREAMQNWKVGDKLIEDKVCPKCGRNEICKLSTNVNSLRTTLPKVVEPSENSNKGPLKTYVLRNDAVNIALSYDDYVCLNCGFSERYIVDNPEFRKLYNNI